MKLDDLILWLTMMGYEKGKVQTYSNGDLSFDWPQDKNSYCTFQDPIACKKSNDEWLIQVKPLHTWKYFPDHNPVVTFLGGKGRVQAYMFSDMLLDRIFGDGSVGSFQSAGRLATLLNVNFKNAVDNFMEEIHAKN